MVRSGELRLKVEVEEVAGRKVEMKGFRAESADQS
jgi:hypothetical protein